MRIPFEGADGLPQVFTAQTCPCCNRVSVMSPQGACIFIAELSMAIHTAVVLNWAFGLGKRQAYTDLSRQRREAVTAQRRASVPEADPSYPVQVRCCTACGESFTVPACVGSTECPSCRRDSGGAVDVMA